MSKRIDAAAVFAVLRPGEEHPGLFEQVLGFRVATRAYKTVHLMNDLAQTLVGGAPADGGDFLCRLIREDEEGEPNTEAEMRVDKKFGRRFDAAFPRELGPRRITSLRTAARDVFDFDDGVFKSGIFMASPLATNEGFLGFEGFRRFGIGAYVAAILGERGKERLRSLLQDLSDPISRAFRPLTSLEPLVARPGRPAPASLSRYDVLLGQRLSTLLDQPLSKPAIMRSFALGVSLGLALKVLGAGRAGGRPVALALAVSQDRATPRLREPAVQTFKRGVEALHRRIAVEFPAHPLARDAWSSSPQSGAEAIDVSGATLKDAAVELLTKLRSLKSEDVVWPEEFAIHFGQKAGCVRPKDDRAGWGTYLALSPDLIEVIVLMSVPAGAPPMKWAKVWAGVREDLGLLIGADPSSEALELREAGVLHVSMEALDENAEEMLRQGVRRGVARRLPDGGAEAGGGL